MSPDDPRHGTNAGYQQHRRDDEDACDPCKHAATDAAARRRDYEPVALTGGRWVLDPVTRVQRWEPDKEFRRPPKPPRPEPPPTDLIVCPCGARLTQTCKTAGGNPTNPHKERVASRRCACGALLEPRKQMCTPCRQRARKQTYRLREIRKATATRRGEDVAA